jgi:hypothetical protein
MVCYNLDEGLLASRITDKHIADVSSSDSEHEVSKDVKEAQEETRDSDVQMV